MTTPSAVCPVLVGRAGEIRDLEAAADRRNVTLVAGEAGVGKSRLASEAVRLAETRGWHRMVGYCTPDAGVPYGPFVTAVRRRTRTLADDALARLFDGAALLASALLPEVARAVGLPASSVSSEEDLFAAVWQLLNRLSAPEGALLLLEDLHWADTDSLRLFSYLARETADLGTWMVGTYRADELHRRHPLTGVLADLGRERRYREIRLGSLGRDDLRQMVSAILDDTEVGDEFLDAVLERTEGNPFFVEELVKVLVERGDIFHQAGDWARRDLADIEMPLTVRETLLARARTLADDARRALELAALAGDRLDLDVLARAAEIEEAALASVVEEGLRLQLLTERRDGPVTAVAFRHALTREAFADEVVGPPRQQAHRRIAEALRAVHAEELDQVAAELADHYAEGGERTAALEYGLRAARFACSSLAWEEAGRRYDRALQLMDRTAPERQAVLLEAAEALREGGESTLVDAFAIEAGQLAHARGDRLAEGRALLVRSRTLWVAGESAQALEVLRRGAELIGDADDWQRALAEARLIRMLALTDHPIEMLERLPGAIELATRVENWSALSALQGTALISTGYGPEFEATYLSALTAARRAGDAASEWNLETNTGYVRLWCGDLSGSRRALVRAVELTERYAPSFKYPAAGYAWLLSLTGEYDESWDSAQPLRNSTHVPTAIVALTALYEVAERRGKETEELVEELAALAARTGEAQRTVPAAAALARHELAQKGAGAAPRFWEALAVTSDASRGGSHWMFSPDLARALAEEGEAGELERWAQAVHRLTEVDAQPHNRAADELVHGFAASVAGDDQAARRSFTEAAELFAVMPCPARQAEALLGLADHLARAEGPESGVDPARRALEVARGIGAGPLAERARRAIERGQAPAVLASVLFTDIVGSTERLTAMGDRAWRDVLARHNTLVRRELAQWKGHEVNTTGDGFVVWFDTPAPAIRCALALRHALGTAGITVRSGLHTGECQVSGDDLSGITVHIAARVSALAGAGEVLVSRTIRDLVAGSGFAFEDRGTHTLKGVEGDWQLYAVTS